jgi:hypothetical protein
LLLGSSAIAIVAAIAEKDVHRIGRAITGQ